MIRKELDPIKGMMQGKLKLKGDLPTIVRAVKASQELVNSSATVAPPSWTSSRRSRASASEQGGTMAYTEDLSFLFFSPTRIVFGVDSAARRGRRTP